MTAHEADKIYLTLSLLVPCATIVMIKRGWIAIPLATISHWLILEVGGRQIQELDPERDAVILDSIWRVFGWIPALFLAIILWSIKTLLSRRMKKRKEPNKEMPHL